MPRPTGSDAASKNKAIGVKVAAADYEALHWYADVLGKSVGALFREVGGVVVLRRVRSLSQGSRLRPSLTPSQCERERNRYALVLEKIEKL